MADVDEANGALRTLVAKAFPAIQQLVDTPWLVPPDGPSRGDSYLWIHLSRVLMAQPSRPSAEAAVCALPDIAQADGKFIQWGTGSGGVLQAPIITSGLIQYSLTELLAAGVSFDVDSLATHVVSNLELLRRGLAGEPVEVTVLHLFGGAQLATGSSVATEWGRLRPAHRLVAAETGLPAGVVSCVLPVKEKVVFKRGDGFDLEELKERNLRWSAVQRMVSLATLLGSEATDPAAAIPLRTFARDLCGGGGGGGSLRFIGLQARSRPLTNDEVRRVESWLPVVKGKPMDHIDVGIDRLILCAAERNSFVDGLIDAVTAWENLVQHAAQSVASVTHGMITLRSGLTKKRIAKIYGLRSSIIHGDRVTDWEAVREARDEALTAGVLVLGHLVTSHPELLEMTSEDRVMALGFVPAGKARCGQCGEPCRQCGDR